MYWLLTSSAIVVCWRKVPDGGGRALLHIINFECAENTRVFLPFFVGYSIRHPLRLKCERRNGYYLLDDALIIYRSCRAENQYPYDYIAVQISNWCSTNTINARRLATAAADLLTLI